MDMEQPPDYYESNQRAQQYQMEQLPRRISSDSSSHDSPNRKNAVQLESGSAYFYFILAFYSVLAIGSWVIICLIGRRPSFSSEQKEEKDYTAFSELHVAARWLHGALVLSTIAAMLTVPTTAAVFAYAAVPSAQYHTQRPNFTLRQTATLVDEGWRSPRVLVKLLSPSYRAKHDSQLLRVAIVLTMLGLAVYPVQQGFLKPISETKRPSWDYEPATQYSINIAHLSDLVPGNNMYVDRGTIALRKALATWQPKDCNPRLWMSGTRENMTKWQQLCARNEEYGLGLENLDRLSDPFIAQLPYGFNTGFKQVYTPRINTTVSYEEIAIEDAPEGCFTTQYDTRFVKHQYEYANPDRSYQYWNVSACISSTALIPQIQNTRNRQGFEESFYMHLTGSDENAQADGVFKVSAQTTIGYFELPNHSNGNIPGPLLDTYPPTSSSDNDNTSPSDPGASAPAAAEILEDVPAKGPLTTLYLALFGNGSFPYAMSSPTYLAYLNLTSSTTTHRSTTHGDDDDPHTAPDICQDVPAPPFSNQLFAHRAGGGAAANTPPPSSWPYCPVAATSANTQPRRGPPSSSSDPSDPSSSDDDDPRFSSPPSSTASDSTTHRGVADPGQPVRAWLDAFSYAQITPSSSSLAYRARVAAAFRAATYTANEIWLTDPSGSIRRGGGAGGEGGGSGGGGSLEVEVDEGVDAAAPVMPLAGVVVGSVLLGAFLAALWAVLVWAARARPRWTGTMDAWAVLRMGAAVGEELAAEVADRGERGDGGGGGGGRDDGVLDRLPGFVGDARPEGDVGVLRVGAEGGLKWRRKYEVGL